MGPVATALDGADRTFPSLEKILSASQPCSGRLPGRPLGMLELAYKGLGQKGGVAPQSPEPVHPVHPDSANLHAVHA